MFSPPHSSSVRGWRTHLCRLFLPRDLRAWLYEQGSLTACCQQIFPDFRVRLLRQCWGVPEEIRVRRFAPIRDVALQGQGETFIFAHTVLLGDARGRLSVWLRRLGRRSLGSLLFSHPGFVRETLQFRRLDARDRLYRVALKSMSPPQQARVLSQRAPFWARSCEHRLGRQSVRVTEVFVGLAISQR